jgi:flagellar basal body-associated protein FliL
MKTIWLMISVLAVANILALVGFVAWLSMTNRLSSERIDRVRLVFASTLEQQAAAEADAQAEAEAETADAEARAKLAVPPETAASRIAKQEQAEEVRLQHILRQQRELEDLRRTLERDRTRLADEEARLVQAQKDFEAYRLHIAEIEGADQFKKALTTLESQKPADARAILQSMIDEQETEQVVSYLGAMEDRIRGKVLAEFAKGDAALAADLLERLRTRGVVPLVAEVPAP